MKIELKRLQQRKKDDKPRVIVCVKGSDITEPTVVQVLFEIAPHSYKGDEVTLTKSEPGRLSCAWVQETGRRWTIARAFVAGVKQARTEGMLDYDKEVSPENEPAPGPCPGD
jgi:hypothetical protein